LEREDKWILSKLNRLIKEVTENMEAYELGVASAKVYDFIWSDFCDWYIELTKARLQGENEKAKVQAQQVLVYVLTETLKLLHPFMPFITEEIWQALPHSKDAGKFLMTEQWPVYQEELDFQAAEEAMESVMDVIRAVRSRRAEMNVPPSRKAALTISTPKAEVFAAGRGFLTRLAYASSIEIDQSEPTDTSGMVVDVTHDAKVYMPLAELVDIEKEKARLQKDLGKKQGELKGLEGKLSNQGFLNKAPAEVVAAEKERAAKLKTLIAKIEEQLASF
jgi:valyl-tRNA synthetase